LLDSQDTPTWQSLTLPAPETDNPSNPDMDESNRVNLIFTPEDFEAQRRQGTLPEQELSD
jgi:hypothetical protein